ncbi:MAG: GNAT family N-acetyltransferase [Clostridiales bacterium]|nr:GNAT family N-acetyltransferase [Clostridiales bacterium]
MIKYRRIEKEEKEKVKTLINEVLGKIERKEFFMPYKEKDYEDMFNKSKYIIYGAYDEEKLVGTGSLKLDIKEEVKNYIDIESKKILKFSKYLVLEEYRNQGIMKTLEHELMKEAKALKYEYGVITVHPENEASKKVIKHLGAELVKTTYIDEYLREIYLVKL